MPTEAILFYFRGAERIMIILAAMLCIVLGYRLFIKGVTGKASLHAKNDKTQFRVLNAAPGLFFCLFGAIILVVALMRSLSAPTAAISFTSVPPYQPTGSQDYQVTTYIWIDGRGWQQAKPFVNSGGAGTLPDSKSDPLPKASAAPSPPRPKQPSEPALLGRGGAEHKYLQYLIKRLGEERGFRAIIEEQIGGGRSVDVVLRRESVALAFEISVTSETEHELANVRKCAGLEFSHFFFVSTSKRKRDQLARAVKDDIALARVTALGPEDIVPALDALANPVPAESTVRGYKVKINRQTVSYEDVANKRSEIAKIIAKSVGARSSK